MSNLKAQFCDNYLSYPRQGSGGNKRVRGQSFQCQRVSTKEKIERTVPRKELVMLVA